MPVLTKKSSLLKITLILFISFVLGQDLIAQDHHLRFSTIDIQHYKFEIGVNDSTNIIEGETTVLIKFLKPLKEFHLDLRKQDSITNTGMTVLKVFEDNIPVRFSHSEKKLKIISNNNSEIGEIRNYIIKYSGTPRDGLIISENKFGKRTFFGDNWPDRAFNWLPCVDHPSDKATVEFIVSAPDHYQVVSNGIQTKRSKTNNGFIKTFWKEDSPISTKVMVIGVAGFATKKEGKVNKIPVSTWVFPENKEFGFSDFSVALKPLKFFSEKIGDYPYKKLANVQSKTRYGGMENANCIFYNEKTVTGKKDKETLFAHEIAHQWFGNSVTEQNWHHLWLSEGFATYLANVYIENEYGRETFLNKMKSDRQRIINYAHRNYSSIIDTTVTEYIRLLNTNSYQKGSWVLHMLRNKIDDGLFMKGLQQFYTIYKDSTALTSDFQKTMEDVSGTDLENFFKQWLYYPGFPVLDISFNKISDKTIELTINQVQEDNIFQFEIEVNLANKKGDSIKKIFFIESPDNKFIIKTNSKITDLIIDPDCKLLFDQKI